MSYSKKKKSMTINRPLLALLALTFAAGLFIGKGVGVVSKIYETGTEEFSAEGDGEFRFIRPLSGYGHSGDERAIRELKPFRYKVKALVENEVKMGEASIISVYFRDLISGHRFGIREQETFSSEILLKLPLMIAYFKWAESNSLILRRKTTYAGNSAPAERQSLTPAKTLEDGKSYTIDELIYRMITYNDNNAYALLLANLPPGYLDRIFQDIYVNYNPAKSDAPVPFSAYASFYRVLFNASYLNKEMSEKALHYLSRSVFRDGMIAGVPPNIDRATKFGERTLRVETENEEKEMHQLHECGIIYYPNRPYLMGVMARGDDPEKLANVIRNITVLVYEEMDRQSRY
jgi:beta-lactamase class A